ncbi:hypothetical protein G6F60_009458 [Rhizopus arrhizus]|nr:hypothetical protein G6F60_009458 [Rhizopus arrhizus]
MSKQPTMQELAYALQSQFLLRSLTLPEDALLHHLLPHNRQPRSHSQWYKLSRSPIWKRCLPDPISLDCRSLKSIQRDYRQGNLDNKRSTHASVLLQHCRPTISLDPVLWLPMSKSERSRCIRWRLGWLPGGRYKDCPRHPGQPFTKAHTIHCLQMHRRLMMPETISGPLSFLLKMLPTKKPRSPNTTLSWTIRWPIICRIPYELDYLYHAKKWSHFWKMPVSPESQSLWYRLLHRKLFSQPLLSKFDSGLASSQCKFCSANTEDLQHFFVRCPMKWRVWIDAFNFFSPHLTFTQDDACSILWSFQRFPFVDNTDLWTFSCCVLFVIWRAH